MPGEEEKQYFSGHLEVRGIKYEATMNVVNGDTLGVEVEDCSSLDNWSGTFDAAYIEELSHKTGNFKQFNIFVSMLESALNQTADSVSLDILTYEDLEQLRQQKHGQRGQQKHPSSSKISSKFQLKRYLIMTYTVEFDRIHYPLPLNYVGKTDPVVLRKALGDLKQEVGVLRMKLHGKNNHEFSNGSEIDSHQHLVQENQMLSEQVNELRDQLGLLQTGNVAKELKVLKKVIQNLENDLLKEKNKYQRLLSKKKKEYDELAYELEELKASERHYRVRCKSLTEELSHLKKSSFMSPASAPHRDPATRGRSGSSSSKQQLSSRRGIPECSTNQRRSYSRNRSISRERSISASSTGRTPSPGFRRFDPSAYVKEKERKQSETNVPKSTRRTPTSANRFEAPRRSTPRSDAPSGKSRPPSGSYLNSKRKPSRSRGESRERHSSAGSETDSVNRFRVRSSSKKGSAKRTAPAPRFRYSSETSEDERHVVGRRSRLQPQSGATRAPVNPARNRDEAEETSGSQSIGIAEIDARLEALQKFMKDNIG